MTKNKVKKKSPHKQIDVPTILIVDDEPDIIELLELTLARMGMNVESAQCINEAKTKLDSYSFQLCLTDMRLPDGDGLELVRYIDKHCAGLPVAVITAYGTAENAVAALKSGAFDYLSKPISLEKLRMLVKSALNLPPIQPEKIIHIDGKQRDLLGESTPMRELQTMIEKLSRSQAAVYISGESGSGKELAARLLHEKSARHKQPFIPVNCGAIPENLMESEFFGYKKGAFTGATADHDGFFQAANGGTLFLDEVADLPLTMQVKLLRVIQEKQVRKIGATQEENVDTRIISATHQNLSECVNTGKFRQDLYYRLNVIALKMPSLREMREDIPLLSKAVLTRLIQTMERTSCTLSEEALAVLAQYDFPGNVRELENIIERTLALYPDTNVIGKDQIQLPTASTTPKSATLSLDTTTDGCPLQDYLDKLEKESIVNALEKNRYNRTAAAKTLGISVRSMRYRMERLGLNKT